MLFFNDFVIIENCLNKLKNNDDVRTDVFANALNEMFEKKTNDTNKLIFFLLNERESRKANFLGGISKRIIFFEFEYFIHE